MPEHAIVIQLTYAVCFHFCLFFVFFQQTGNEWKSSQCGDSVTSAKKNHKKENSLLKFLAVVCTRNTAVLKRLFCIVPRKIGRLNLEYKKKKISSESFGTERARQ